MLSLNHLAIAANHRPEIAYVGRYYYRPGLGKVSKFYVYATDLLGKHRLRVSADPVAASTTVTWADRNTIAWQTSGSWQLYNVQTGKRKSAKHVTIRARSKWNAEHGSLKYKSQPPIHIVSGGAPMDPVVLSRGTSKVKVRGEFGIVSQVVPTKSPLRTLVVFTSSSANGLEDEDEVLSVDWSTGKVLPWHRNLKQIQFFPDRDLFLARHQNRELIPYGKSGNVWADRIYLGRMSSHRMWMVVGGLVWCGAPALRPP